MADTLVRLQPIFHDVFDDPKLVITAESNAKNVEGWDSLMHVSLIAAIEQEFSIRFALGELERLNDVGELVAAIDRKVAKA
jgi:acyl carrier protein